MPGSHRQNRQRVNQNQSYYKRQQAIVEHPYGTIKQQCGFDHIITKKDIERASADVGLLMTAYNLHRLINIIGLKTHMKWAILQLLSIYCFFGTVRLKIDTNKNLLSIRK